MVRVKEVCGYTEKAKQMIDWVKEQNIRVILATNPIFPKVATKNRAIWAGVSIDNFEHVTTYEDCSYCKPNPKYYEEILKRQGLLPEECLMVGNDVTEDLVAETLGMQEKDILGEDLYLYTQQEPMVVGAQNELLVSPRLDDLQCAYSTLKGFVDATAQNYISVYMLFNNEEVGSLTRQGADSDFAVNVLKKIWDFVAQKESFEEALEDSFLLSTDNAHALHPNHPEKSDITNKPYLNKGVVLKFNGNAHYTTDGYSQAFVTDLCRECEIPMQTFVNRSDLPGGSTLGNILMAHISMASADIGLPQLAMHSAVETAGVKYMEYMEILTKHFLSK